MRDEGGIRATRHWTFIPFSPILQYRSEVSATSDASGITRRREGGLEDAFFGENVPLFWVGR